MKKNKITSTLESTKKPEPIKRSKIDVKEDTIIVNQRKLMGAFNDKYIKYKNKDENTSIEQYIENIIPYLRNI